MALSREVNGESQRGNRNREAVSDVDVPASRRRPGIGVGSHGVGSICGSLLVSFQIGGGDFSGRNWLVMLLRTDADAIGHELGGDRAAQQRRKLARADREVLFNLHDAQFVRAALGLDREDLVEALILGAKLLKPA